MKKFLKILVVTFGLVVSSVVVIVLLDFGMEKYEEVTWTPPTEIDGIYLGMTRSDLVFEGGYLCVDEDLDIKTCSFLKTMSSGPKVRVIDDVVVTIETFRGSLPKSLELSVEELISKLGEPDFLYTSDNLDYRTYTYLNYRTSHFFISSDEKWQYVVGDLDWEDIIYDLDLFDDKPLGKLIFKGRPLCPSPQCPFNEDKSLKDDYPYKTPFDLT